jgi:hypothetical protein
METKPLQQDVLRRLAAAAIVIFSLCFAIGLIIGYVEYFALAGIVIAVIFSRPLSKRLHTMEFSIGAMIPVVVSLVLVYALFLVSILLRGQTENLALRIAIGFLPAFPIAATALFIGRAIGKLDDLQRRIQTEGIAIGFGIFIVLVSIYGWLTFFGVPQIEWIFATPAMAMCWVVGKLCTMWRYR